MTYEEFLQTKFHDNEFYGFKPLWIPDFLFPFQQTLCSWAIRKGKSAIFADCGLGKSVIELVWSENIIKETNKPVLLLTPLAVAPQMVREGEKFGIKVTQTREGKVHKGINVTNYERLKYFEPEDFAGVVADESGCLKALSSQTRKLVTKFLYKVPYRLLASATPAPNDFMELGSSSEALGSMKRSQMLGMFFTNGGDSTQSWELKGHSRKRFWKWVASWARALRTPSDLGFSDEGYILPKLTTEKHVVEDGLVKGDGFFRMAMTLNEQREERRDTLEARCKKVAELADTGDYVIIWCHLNAEGDLLEKLIPDSVQVKGSDTVDFKEKSLSDFATGKIRVLISKQRIGGWGLNLQVCNHIILFPSHCYDDKTEVLTKRGWLGFQDVTTEDFLATVNQDSLAFEWQNPTEVIWEPYSGKMIHFHSDRKFSRSFDLLVTPNHNMFVKRCSIRYGPKNSGKWKFMKAEELKNGFKRQEYRMLSSPKSFVGNVVDEIEIPLPEGVSRNHSRLKHIDKMPISKFVQLAGWYLSEGYCGDRKGYVDGQITICQTDKYPHNRKEIIDLLESIPGMNVYKKTKDIRCCSIQLANFLVKTFGAGSRNKFIPSWVKELDFKYLKLLRDTMLKGDGSGLVGEEKYYRTASKKLADDFSEICLKTGLRGTIRYRVKTNSFSDFDCYDVIISRKRLEPSIHIKPEEEDYSGMVGCATVPNHTLIVRRNGITVISGNSWESYYQGIRRCWRFGQERPVKVDIVTSQGEREVISNMARKERQMEEMFVQLVAEMQEYQVPVKKQEKLLAMERPKWI